MHAGRARHLREVHRTELAGADQADSDRFALSGTLLKLGVQIHAACFASAKGTSVVCSALAGSPCFQGTDTG